MSQQTDNIKKALKVRLDDEPQLLPSDGKKYKYWNVLIDSHDETSEFKNPVPVTFEFKRNCPPIGTAILRRYGKQLFAIHMVTNADIIGLTPATGYRLNRNQTAMIMEISMCGSTTSLNKSEPIGDKHVVDGRIEAQIRQILVDNDELSEAEMAGLIKFYAEEQKRAYDKAVADYYSNKDEHGGDELS